MNLFIDTTHRTDEEEIMDDFSIDGKVLHDTLDTLATINKWLGGNKIALDSIKKVLKNHPKTEPITIIDLGCGGGDILRRISIFGKKAGYRFNLIGIDANKDAIVYAKKLSEDYDNISYFDYDLFSEEFDQLEYDLVLSTLFLHHFKEAQIISVLEKILQKAKLGIIVNDLHRHPMAYYLFKLITIPVTNRLIIEDGLTSVLRAFKRKELVSFSEKLNVVPYIKWKWAFRYQWIIQK